VHLVGISSEKDSRSKTALWEAIRNVPVLSCGLLLFILACSAAWYSFQTKIINQKRESSEAAVESYIQQRLTERIQSALSDLFLIADEPRLRSFLDHPTEASRRALGARLAWWSKHESDYYEIRLLDAMGRDWVRINHNHGRPYPVPSGILQGKAHRYFFAQTMALGEGEVFISPLDLNVDDGAIERPLHPTIRVCAPAFDSRGRKRGILVLNYEGRNILTELNKTIGPSAGRLQLLNSDGYWLKGMTPDNEWGFMFDDKKDRTFGNSYPTAWPRINGKDSGSFYDRDGLFVFRTIRPIAGANRLEHVMGSVRVTVPTGYPWKLVSYVPRSAFAEDSRRLISWIVLVDALVFVPLALYFLLYAWARVQRHRIEIERQQQAKLLDLAEDAIFMLDLTYKLRFWNTGAAKQYGWTKDEVLGQDAGELLKTTFPKPLSEIKSEALRTGYWEGEVTRQNRAGDRIVSFSRWTLQYDVAGRPSAIFIINHDITYRKQVEDALRKAHRELEMILKAVPSLLIVLNTAGAITRWNSAAEVAFGLAESSVLGKTLGVCGVQWIDEPPEADIAALLKAERSGTIERIRFAKKEETRFLAMTLTQVRADDGTLTGFLIVGADITERTTLETQLRQAQKLEAIGQLAAGIAHEINTPTQYVGDNMVFLKECWASIGDLIPIARRMREEAGNGAVPRDTLTQFDVCSEKADLEYLLQEAPRALDQSLKGVQRVAKIVRAMKEFSHPGAEEKKPIDINRAIETTITVARNEWKYVAELNMRLDPSLPLVPCLAGEFNQVILNLVVNAAHAIAERNQSDQQAKGDITVSTRGEADWVEISVQDTGVGIPEPIHNRVFEPFFTTKEVGKGTGQGLALAYAVVAKKHGGKIWFESETGKGTTFFIRLPLATGGA
jgi:PAS domain S-box-containing protein